MFCRRCGAQIPQDSTFCMRCGTPVAFAGAAANPPPAGEQFFPPPAWQSPPPTVSGWAYPLQPGPMTPPPPQPPPWNRLFGPRLQPGAQANHRNLVQRRLLSAFPASVASSSWFGAVLGSVCAFAVVLLLSLAFSLALGPTLDQYSADTSIAASSSLGTSQNQDISNTATISHYANPLLVVADANQSKLVEHITEGLDGDSGLPSSAQVGVTGTLAMTPAMNLLLILPAIGLTLGGYLAASTDYTERRLFSITRGASTCVLYALGVLIVSLFATGSLTFTSSTGGLTVTANGSITPDVLSVVLNALLWGAVFGALGGYLRARAFPAAPQRRLYERIRGALTGAGAALGVYFLFCLLLTIALYVVGHLFTPVLLSQSTTSSGTANNLCSALAQATSDSAHPAGGSDLARYLTFLISSPALALWMMTLSMGAPIQISGVTDLSIGLFGADCQLGPGGILYALLLVPAAAIFFGGWIAARVTRPRTITEAAGLGLLMTGALAIVLLLCAVLASTTLNESLSLSVNALGNNIQQSTTQSISEGPAVGSVLLVSLLFGCVFSLLGSLAGQPRHVPPLQPSAPSAWPAPPAGWPPASPAPTQPVFSPSPGSPAQSFTALSNQPTIVTPPSPEAAPPGSVPDSAPGDAPEPASPPDQTS